MIKCVILGAWSIIEFCAATEGGGGGVFVCVGGDVCVCRWGLVLGQTLVLLVDP